MRVGHGAIANIPGELEGRSVAYCGSTNVLSDGSICIVKECRKLFTNVSGEHVLLPHQQFCLTLEC